MTTHYARLLQLTVAHAYFRSGVIEAVRVHPTAETRRALQSANLKVRQVGPTWLLGVEVDRVVPALGDPPEAHVTRPLPADVLTFGLELASPTVVLVSEIDDWRPGAAVHYLSNLTPSGPGDFPYLTDHVAGERLGPPISLVTRSPWIYALSAPASEVDLTVTDLFGTTVAERRMVFDGPVSEVSLDFDALPGLSSGRYVVSDGDGGSESVYYAPGLDGRPLFAMIELYVSSVPFTGPPDQVVGDYRFLDGDRVSETAPFAVEIPVRSTHWTYVLEKKYADNGVDLSRVDVTGDLSFSKTSSEPTRTTFESGAATAWSEDPATVTLEDHRGRALRRLPVPGPGTVVRARETGGRSAVQMVYL